MRKTKIALAQLLRREPEQTLAGWFHSPGLVFHRAGGPVGTSLRRGCYTALVGLPLHTTSQTMFPLPLPSLLPLARRGRARARALKRRSVNICLDSIFGLLKLLRTASSRPLFTLPSIAQTRVLKHLTEHVKGLLCEGCSFSDASSLQIVLREGPDAYMSGPPAALPFGTRAGFPESAGLVDVVAVLRSPNSAMADLFEDPEKVLLPSSDLPAELPECRSLLIPDTLRLLTRLCCGRWSSTAGQAREGQTIEAQNVVGGGLRSWQGRRRGPYDIWCGLFERCPGPFGSPSANICVCSTH